MVDVSTKEAGLDLQEPWRLPWPAEHLQHIQYCPVCGAPERELMHRDLVDNAFRAARGTWTLYRCGQCNVAYLDPRPDEHSIGDAYKTYYTHTVEHATRLATSELSWIKALQRRLANGYLNHRYGTSRLPASPFGFRVVSLFPSKRQTLDVEFRYLPKPLPAQKMLDIGCGNGAFLSLAKEAGWQVAGIDFDPKAVATAIQRGFDVRLASIESFDGISDAFDAITLNHVIEHVHDPVKFLHACHRLLKPGGQLWVETPNIESLGHQNYGRYWRGLEPPRHLVLFDGNALRSTLVRAGFSEVHGKSRPSPLREMCKASEAIKQGLPMESVIPFTRSLKWRVWIGRVWQWLVPSSREFLSFVAIKQKIDNSSGAS